MTTETINQAANLINSSNSILVLVSSGSNLDAVAAGLGLGEFLAKIGKQTRLMAVTPLAPKLAFLAGAERVEPAQTLSKNLLVEVSLAKTQLSELTYQKQDDILKIYLTPKSGGFEENEVKVRPAVYPFDLIVTVGITSLEELGSFYANHAEMFFQTPVVNLDYQPANENFGQVNVVSLVSSAVSEVVFDLLQGLDTNVIDEKIATLLLAGLVFQTNSFQTQKTSPQVFLKASKLVEHGAKQQEIISQLYRTKSLGLLHLWGRVLARLKQDAAHALVFSAVSKQDVERSSAQESDVDEIIFEMIQQLSFAKHLVFLAEKSENESTVYVFGSPPINVQAIFSGYAPQLLPQRVLKFTVPKNLILTEAEVVAAMVQEMDKYK